MSILTIIWLPIITYLSDQVFVYIQSVQAYLSPSSFHPPHITRNIPKGVAIRIRRICSEESEFLEYWIYFRDVVFARRGYAGSAVDGAFRKPWNVPFKEMRR